jgi:glycerol-3-phosphate acyltransferase PlsY
MRGWQPIALALVALCTYIYGSIPFAYLATYLFTRRSLTKEGTGNVGVINAFRTGGVLAVVLTLLGELSKAPFSVGLAQLIFPGQDAVKLVAILAAFIGTNYSLFLRGKGGRGSTMLMWSIALVSFHSFLILGAITGLCFILARLDVRLKSLWFWAIPVVLYLVERELAFLVFGLLVVVVIYLKGRGSKDDLVYYGYVQDR